MVNTIPAATVSTLAARVSNLIDWAEARDEKWTVWVTGTPTGGPNNDGRYPLPWDEDEDVLVECPQLLKNMLVGPAAAAASSATASAASATQAAASLAAIGNAVSLAEAARDAAVVARNESRTARDESQNHAANSLTQANNAAASAASAAAQATAAAASAASALGAPGTNATSTTSMTIGTGSRTFNIQPGKALSVGQSVVIASSVNPSNQMVGIITAHNSTTGSMTVNVSQIGGSGTLASWVISLTASVVSSLTTASLSDYANDQASRQAADRRFAVAFALCF